MLSRTVPEKGVPQEEEEEMMKKKRKEEEAGEGMEEEEEKKKAMCLSCSITPASHCPRKMGSEEPAEHLPRPGCCRP